MILKCKNLRYLDDRPVFPRDRACAEAWMRGGPDEEAAERKRWIEAEQKKINDSVQAQINKRKLYKPVGTSEKEAEDKKKTKEDEEEVAKRTVVCTSNELLHLEKKKKSDAPHSSGSSASSSSDEEVYDGTGQKGIEKSDGRRPMAEEGRKASPGIGREISLPWKTEVHASEKPRKLIEEVHGTEEYVAGDAERKRIGREILDERKSVDDPPGGYALGRELAHYEQLVLKTSNQTESTPAACCQQEKDDIKEEKVFKSTSVSCDIVVSKSGGKKNEEEIVNDVKNKSSSRDSSDNYQRNDNSPHPLSSQLTSIREDMKDFCSGMDKFMEENKIVFKNGDVKRFWGEIKEINPKTKSEANKGSDEIESSAIMEEEGRNAEKWWSTKERKLKVKEILKKREEEVQKSRNVNKIKTEDDTKKVSDKKEGTKETKEDSMSQGVYDLLNLKTCPKILLDDIKSYPENEDDSIICAPTKKEEKEERFLNAFESLFDEMKRTRENYVKPKEASKPISSQDLLTIEEENEGVEEAVRPASNTDTILSDVNSSKSSSDQKIIKKRSVRIEILEANSVNSTDDDESDNESVKTVIDTYEKSTETNAEVIVQEANRERSATSKMIEELNMEMGKDMGYGKSTQSPKSYKRMHDREYVGVGNKKSCLSQEMDTKKEYDNKESTSDVYDSFGQHLIEEAMRFIKKESPSVLHNESIAQLLISPETGVNSSKECANLYQEFCEHLERMNSERKLLIEPDFMKNNKEKSEGEKCDVLSLREPKQSNDEQTKPLVEIISEDSRNIEKEEPPIAAAENIAMDTALRSKILTRINAPKSDEQRERGKKSAEKLMKISREAMVKGKSLIGQTPINYNQQLHFDDSRRFFMNLLKGEPAKEVEDIVDSSKTIEKKNRSESITENIADALQSSVVGVENAAKLSSIDDNGTEDNEVCDTEKRNVGRSRKSLEMQIVQQK
ncbi:unnamed protein product [Xylocopa violacea]|uniref:Dynein assembly factor 1, axonemal homolog n=1 Tax=Xylocopa violacea TaxID=135666 RepID=A0ABP1NYY2_XYLVO